MTEDVAWHVPGRNTIAGDYRGTDAVLAYCTRRGERMAARWLLPLDADAVDAIWAAPWVHV